MRVSVANRVATMRKNGGVDWGKDKSDSREIASYCWKKEFLRHLAINVEPDLNGLRMEENGKVDDGESPPSPHRREDLEETRISTLSISCPIVVAT